MPIVIKQQHKKHQKSPIQPSIQQLNVLNVFNAIRKQSQTKLQPQEAIVIDYYKIQDIQNYLKSKQQLVYELMLLTPQQYIAHQFTKLQNKNVKTDAITGVQLMHNKFLLQYQLTNDKTTHINIKNTSPYFNKQGYQSLNQQAKSYFINKSNIPNSITTNDSYSSQNKILPKRSFSLSANRKSLNRSVDLVPNQKIMFLLQKKREQQLSNILQFKQKSYWQKNQEKTKKIKQFLQNHQRTHQQRYKKYSQSIQKSKKRSQQQIQRQRQQKQQLRKSLFKKGLQRSIQYRQKRESIMEQHQNQLQKIDQFLQKITQQSFVQNKRLYQVLQERYNQKIQEQQQKKQQILAKIKEQHTPFDQQQLDQHIQKYEEYKQSLNEQLRTKKQQFQTHKQQIQQELKNLYHGKRYQKASKQYEQQSPVKQIYKQILQRKSKKKDFAQNVIQNFKPKISRKKRKQLQESIRLLQLSQDKSKKKVIKNGNLQYQQKTSIDRYKKGVQYLQFLHKYLQNKPRKKQQRPTSTSVIQLKNKKIDYLHENKPNIKFKQHSMIEWKKVMDDNSFKTKDKYVFLKQSINTLEHKAIQKQIEARNLKKSSQQLQKKDQFDKYYIQSIQAKMAILNNLMLNKNM